MPQKSISARLRDQLNDLMGLYDTAVKDKEPVIMDKLSKTCAGLAKQIQSFEAHERETLKRDAVIKLSVMVGSAFGKAIKSQVKADPVPLTLDLAYLIIETVNAEVLHMVGEFDNGS